MDARQPYATPSYHHPIPPPPQHHQHPQPSQQPPPPPHTYPPPPQHHPAYPAQPPPQQQQQQQSHSYFPHPHQGPSLPPIQSPAHPAPPNASEQQNLPPIRNPSAPPPPHDARNSADYGQPHAHNRSGHATPAPVNRPYSHDSIAQRTPTTPAAPPVFAHPSGQAPSQEGASAAHPHHPPSMEHAGHHGYPPGGVHMNGMPVHTQHHEGPPPPHYVTPVMEHHPYGGPPPPMYGPPSSYGPASAGPYSAPGKRKHMRATQACEQCRQRKQKCDEGTPCSFCKENSLPCQYRDTPPAKTDKNMERLLQFMETQTEALTSMRESMQSMDRRLRRLEHGQLQHENNSETFAQHGASRDTPDENIKPLAFTQPTPRVHSEDHRTAPHKLLMLWPSIHPLLKKAGVTEDAGYVMEAEDRGVIRYWTSGESAKDDREGLLVAPASPAQSDDSAEGSTAATPYADGVWGFGFPSTPNSDMRRSEPSGQGGLKPNGELDLDASTVNALFDSYCNYMHIIHPILDKGRLRRMINTFIKRHSTGTSRATFAVGNSVLESDFRPAKRQRSNGPTATPGVGLEGLGAARRDQQTERSPANGIIYLVLALGKICAHRDPLPACAREARTTSTLPPSHQMSLNRSFTASSPSTVPIKPSPHSPNTTPGTHPTPPSENGRHHSRSRRSSVDMTATAAGARNLDVIPGLAYYAKAMEIVADQDDGDDLVHAQMFLLAGLYKGQLARVKESMKWYSKAGQVIRCLLERYKLYNGAHFGEYDEHGYEKSGQERIKDNRTGLIVLNAWSCLQLETDILAEMNLPSSGLPDLEYELIAPKKMTSDESYSGLEPDESDLLDAQKHDYILMVYISQLYLRKRLNAIQKDLFGSAFVGKPIGEVKNLIDFHILSLEDWRAGLPEALRWTAEQNNDLPADILNARLRAKYWGAVYLVHRPFLDFALHIMPIFADKDNSQTVEALATNAIGQPRDPADIHIFKAIATCSDKEIWQRAKACVDAAVHSTLALDGVPERPVVTNIHGTAHAQFGNILVLSAVHETNYLGLFLEHDRFQGLLERTIRFLKKLAPISPTCKHDAGILEKFNNTLFLPSIGPKDTYANEGLEPHVVSSAPPFVSPRT